MSKHTIALRGRSVPLSASTSVVASSRHPEEIDDAQPLVAENVPEENAQQVELVLIDGQDAGHTGSSKFSSLVKRDEAPGWKVGSCVVWNQVAKETQAIYEITEIGDDDMATICAIACRFPLPDKKLLLCRVPLWQLEPLSEEPTKAFDASGQLLMIGSRIKIHRDTESATEGIVQALYPEGATRIPYAQVDLDNGKNETLEAAKLEKLDASSITTQEEWQLETDISLEELTARINEGHDRFEQLCEVREQLYRESLLVARNNGLLLLAAKAKVKRLPSARWLPWLEANCPKIAERTAQKYMQLAKKWEEFVEKSASEGGFSPTIDQALKLVSSRSSGNSTVANNQQVWDTEPRTNASDAVDAEIEANAVSDDGEAEKCPEQLNTSHSTSTFPQKTIPKTTSYTSVKAELADKQKELLGTSWNGSQVLPDVERNPAPEEVDDRPFTQPYNDTICQEITLGVVSNQVYFSQSQILAIWKAIAPQLEPESDLWTDTELLDLINTLNKLKTKAEAKLNQQRHL